MAFTPSKALCRFFALGECKREDCMFAHDLAALDSNICRFYLNGLCFYGDQCKYTHVEREELFAEAENNTPRRGFNPIPILPDTNPSSRAPPPGPAPVESPVCVKPERPPLCQLGVAGECTLIDCQLRHGDVCEMCHCQALDPLDANQRVAHEQECCNAMEHLMDYSFALQRSQQVECGVCYEKVLQQPDENRRRFGILPKCDHSFCFDCIMNWRKQARDGFGEGALRSCPMCRTHSDFAIPSLLWPENPEQKTNAIEGFKTVMKDKPCRTFVETNRCPFGSCCWYKHVDANGNVVHLKPPGGSRRRRRRASDIDMEFELSVNDLMDLSDASPNYSEVDDDEDEWEEDLPSPAVPVHLDDDPNFTADIIAQLSLQTAAGGNAHAEYVSMYCGQRNNSVQE